MSVRRAFVFSLGLHVFLGVLFVRQLTLLDEDSSRAGRIALQASIVKKVVGDRDNTGELKNVSVTHVTTRMVQTRQERLSSAHLQIRQDTVVGPASVSHDQPPAAVEGMKSTLHTGETERSRAMPSDIDVGKQRVVVEPVSADGIRQYRLNLAREARRYRRFPQLARANGWEGQVTIVVSTVIGSSLPVASISQSSGKDMLDQAALEMMTLAVRSAAIPEALHKREFALTLPVQFSLED